MQMPLAEAELRSQSRDPAVVDDAPRDQGHGPRDEIAAGIPSRSSWERLGTAALAWAKARVPGAQRSRKEADIFGSRRRGRAARPAEDPGGPHPGEEPAVKPSVAGLHGPIAILELGSHPSIVALCGPEIAHESDFVVSGAWSRPDTAR